MFWTETSIPPQPAHYENVAGTEALPPPTIAVLEPPFLSHQGVPTFEKGKVSRYNEDMCLSAWVVRERFLGKDNLQTCPRRVHHLRTKERGIMA